MHSRSAALLKTVRWLGALALLGALGTGVHAGPPPGKNDPPKPLPMEIVKAWKEAGARVGWMRRHEFGYLVFLSEKEARAGDLPSFQFFVWKEGVLPKLPSPPVAFGLSLRNTGVADAGLKELAGLKSLQLLYLHRTQVKDAGVMELRKVLPQCRILR